MFTIKKAIIKIDTDEYIENLSKYDGYIDCSDSLREPNEVCDVCSYDSADKAEKEIDRTIQLSIDDENVTISYEFIVGSELIHYEKVSFKGQEYSIDPDMYSADCFNAIKESLMK